jgi:hypothetical protein
MRRQRVALLMVAAATLVTACSGTRAKSAGTSTPAATAVPRSGAAVTSGGPAAAGSVASQQASPGPALSSAGPAAPAASSSSNPAALTNAWRYVQNAADGSQITVTLNAGGVEHAAPDLRNDAVVAGHGCDLHEKTDAAIPLALTVTNTGTVDANPGLAQLDANDTEAEVCTDQRTGSLSVNTDSTLAPGQSTQATAFYVLLGYYTAANPNGDPSRYTSGFTIPNPNHGISAITGAGVSQIPGGGYWFIHLVAAVIGVA